MNIEIMWRKVSIEVEKTGAHLSACQDISRKEKKPPAGLPNRNLTYMQWSKGTSTPTSTKSGLLMRKEARMIHNFHIAFPELTRENMRHQTSDGLMWKMKGLDTY